MIKGKSQIHKYCKGEIVIARRTYTKDIFAVCKKCGCSWELPLSITASEWRDVNRKEGKII